MLMFKILRIAAAAAAAAALFFIIIKKTLLPEFFFRFVLKRKEVPAEVFLRRDIPVRDIPVPRDILVPGAAPLSWIDQVDREIVEIQSHDGLILRGYFRAFRDAAGKMSSHTVILAHGYTGDGKQLADFAKFYQEALGFNVLMPHARAHGASEGTWAGFGWLDRLDYLRWIDWVVGRTGTEPGGAGIVLHGVSMGAATVMITAGEETLPPEVLAVVEDCGYTSMEDELYAQMKSLYHIRSPSLMRDTGAVSKKRAGYAFAEVSPLERIKKVTIPVLFIHGEADEFVPYPMVHALYEACSAPKELYTVPGAVHAKAYVTDPETYKKRVIQFIQSYGAPL
jgi:fermentation-respiration switch protein FrsA (DUF1100 family)